MAEIEIDRIVFDLAARDQAMAIWAQDQVSAISGVIASRIESVLSEYDEQDRHILIKRMVLHLAPIDCSQLEDNLLMGIAGAIEQEMAGMPSGNPADVAELDTAVTRRSAVEWEREIIKHFLRTGLAVNGTSDLQITPTRIKKAFYENPALTDWLVSTEDVSRLRRLLYHLNDAELHVLTVGRRFIELKTLLELIRSLVKGVPTSQDQARLYVWRSVFAQKAKGHATFDCYGVVKEYAENMSVSLSECICSLPKSLLDELLRGQPTDVVRRCLHHAGLIESVETRDWARARDGSHESGSAARAKSTERLAQALRTETAQEVYEMVATNDVVAREDTGEVIASELPFDVTEDETTGHTMKESVTIDTLGDDATDSATRDGAADIVEQDGLFRSDRLEEHNEARPTAAAEHSFGITERRTLETNQTFREPPDEFPAAQDAIEDRSLPAVGEKFYLHNAGIVLVAPFLGHFLKSLGFIEGDRFIDRERHERAVVLLHYLYPEHEICEDSLILAKLLCGLAIAAPVPVLLKPKPSELKEIDELIQSVIHHWPALKNTSVEAFRYNFLNRRAVLTGGDYQWHLRVQRESIDVLLETLPWSISVIRHPWMRKAILVEW